MHEHANSYMLLCFDKLVEIRADLIEPYFVEKVLNCSVMQPAMSLQICKVILCVVANFEVSISCFAAHSAQMQKRFMAFVLTFGVKCFTNTSCSLYNLKTF